MGDVVTLKSEPELLIRICNCGCTTWLLRSDRLVECARCHELGKGEEWIIDPPARHTKEVGDNEAIEHITFNGSADFLLSQAKRDAADINAVAVIYNSGRTQVWTCGTPQGDEQRAWRDRKVDDVSRMMKGLEG